MSKPRARGFTLIELLTVIAIIAILVGITAAVLPGVLERAKITKTETTFKQIHMALSAYQTDHGSLPLGYGYAWPKENPEDPDEVPTYNKFPYMERVHFFREFNLYDEYWADNYDTNRNSHIDLLEFQPVGTKSGNAYIFDAEIYDGSNLPAQVAQMSAEVPPFAYFPVNRAQADKLRAYCLAGDRSDANRIYARATPELAAEFDKMSFPPPYYDDYVLISPGPSGNTFGVIPPDDNLIDAGVDLYYVNALRTFYLATRDQNDNGKPDFDFRARTRGGEKEYLLPDGSNGAGPLIFHSGG